MEVIDHKLTGVNYFPSPNYNERPDNEIDLVVIHGISLPPGEFGGDHIADLFLNKLDHTHHEFFTQIVNERVSAHLLIARTGHCQQFVPFNKRAWHAGVSSFEGRADCNNFSIGIELEGTDDLAYTDKQYATLIQVVKALQEQYPGITPNRVVGHCHVAPGRKSDPGKSFDWGRLQRALAE